MKKLFVLLLALMMVAAFVGCAPQAAPAASAEEASLADIVAKGTLIQGMDDAFPPMGFRNESDELVGFDVDVATEVASRIGVKLVPQPIKWSQKENELNTGNIDVIWNGYTITDDRKEKTEMTFPYMKNRQILVVMTDSAYQGLADLAGKKVALQAGSTAEDALNGAADFKASIANGEPVLFDDNLKALLDLEIGGSDAVLMDEIVANYYIATDKPQYRVLDESLADEEYGIGCRKGSVTLKAEIERILSEMAADGTLAKISEKWFGKDVTTVS